MIVTMILLVLALGTVVFVLIRNKKLEEEVLKVNAWAQSAIGAAQNEVDQRIALLRQEAHAALVEAQKLVDDYRAHMQEQASNIKRHYELECRKNQDAANLKVAKLTKELESLRKYEKYAVAESDAKKFLAEAIKEASDLQLAARFLLEQAQSAAATERAEARERSNAIQEEAGALLDQATRDASGIVGQAEKRAKKIAGDAYEALRDKETLEQAVKALWNVTEGYGDRYVVPSQNVLDDLASEFGYDAAGVALKSAREQSRRMVEQKLAAACNYEEPERRERANRFVVDAFNGRVDAILSRIRHDDYGTLEQKVRDAYNLVNYNGLAFRDARILPAYLDVRLSELKWATVVQELARKQREEQKYLRERIRDEEKARKEIEEKMRQAAKEEDLKRQAVAEAEERYASATAEERTRFENELHRLRQDLADATQKILTIAQLTKKGYVYVLSNVGSFGEGVYKIGLTRRMDPTERVDELGDASVPFGFDIHALIESENAPALEHKIHKEFLATQVNKLNFRKEFFRVSLAEIRNEIEKLKAGEDFTIKRWSEKAEATEYRESLDIQNDPEKKRKWLLRQKALADRQLRLDARPVPSATPQTVLEQ